MRPTNRVACAALAVLALAALRAPAQESRAAESRPYPLSVLYAGKAGHPRTEEFAAFLGGAFAKVGTVDLAKLDAAAAKDFDVVIVDSPSPYPTDGSENIKLPRAPRLDPWTKPTVLMGAAGGSFVSWRNLKLDWL